MEYKIKILKAKIEDIEVCVKLAKTKELQYAPGLFPSEKELKSGARHGLFYVAKVEDKIVGFVLGYILSRQSGYIDLLVVEEKYRGQGIGTKLLSKIKKKMHQEEINNAWLIAHENQKDVEFYLKKHFKQGDRFRLFWEDLS